MVGVLGRGLKQELKAVFELLRLFHGGELNLKQLQQRCRYRRSQIRALIRDGWFYKHKRLSRFCGYLLQDFDCLWTFFANPRDGSNEQ